MRFQVTLLLLLSAFMLSKVTSAPLSSLPCAECEDEIWEEIPCEQIPTTTMAPPMTKPIKTTIIPTTITTLPTTLPTTTIPPTTLPPTTLPPTIKTTTMLSTISTARTSKRPKPTLAPTRPTPVNIESRNTFKKCYCECKSGCKEFCRKVVVNPDSKKQITQLSKTIQPLAEGELEVKHLLERNWIRTPIPFEQKNLPLQPQTYYQHNLNAQVQSEPQIPQNLNAQTPETGANYQRTLDVDSFGFSIEELTKLVNSEQSFANMIPEISQPSSVYQNLYASPLQPVIEPKSSQLYAPPQKIASINAKTSNTGNGSARAAATSKIGFKESVANSCSGHQDLESQIGIKPAVAAVYPQTAPRPQQYTYNNLPKEDPRLGIYLRNLLYSSAPKGQGYEHSLSF